MIKNLSLHNFRSYPKRNFSFEEGQTLIVGPNASGKTNILEAIYLLATGKSFRAEADQEMIKEGEEFFRVTGETVEGKWEVFAQKMTYKSYRTYKTYLLNGVGQRQTDFVGNLRAVLFSPQDIEIVADSPSTRRKYWDLVLSLVHKDYRIASHIYERALRQRNRLLWRIKNYELSVKRVEDQLDYWNRLLIENGQVIHGRRKEYLSFLNDLGNLGDSILPIKLDYDHSIISRERLEKYADEEIAAAVTLVGPHRDDFRITNDNHQLRSFGSRGEQRMAVLTIKLGELEYVRSVSGSDPVMLLDDIFSELDEANRKRVGQVIPRQQTIITTTDLRLIDSVFPKRAQVMQVIELEV